MYAGPPPLGRLGVNRLSLPVAGSLRLARFNIMTAKTDHRYFVGLPIPAAALTLAAIINYAPQPVNDRTFAGVMLLVTAGLAFAEVSTIRYRSQKFSNLQRERSFVLLFIVALILVVLYRWPSEFLLILCSLYVSSALWYGSGRLRSFASRSRRARGNPTPRPPPMSPIP